MEGRMLLFVQENVRREWLNGAVVFVTKLGDAGLLWAILTALLLCIPRTRKTGVMCIVSLILVLIVNNLLVKNLVNRVRPYDAVAGLFALVPPLMDSSFPSGHSACSFAVAVVAFRNLPKKIGVPSLLLAFLVALSRIYVGVHYPTDVLCGSVLGTVFALASESFVNRCGEKIKRRGEDQRGGEKT